ncbi:ACR061Cp [Eremothecium gossypii ATCC 10895]|uniref:ACR061Cp n=1 Tax=Eremothecium gossypii (strain ATCC 10895 / CBS 109.51 / FGSC 9923 / NRRL Y-1056) TaxID=284811 RepID=Q75C55_EREGS|nr:ACR061Cp [Eremothecium gossypii ATCC 10895]AAS51288.2 ACR061Cp [Eremothecium gossypii ATCC 10895]AEY95579.1 FACR061Cp [Eremothecium gossypii FDAG1]
MKWSVLPFEELYNSIQAEQFDLQLYNSLLPDLKELNLSDKYPRNDTSRKQLETGEITLSDGDRYKINQQFIIAAVQLADELNLDELAVAELLLSSDEELDALDQDLLLLNQGKVRFYLRKQFILQVVSYVVNVHSSESEVYRAIVEDGQLIDKILKGCKAVHQQLDDIKQSINKAQILDTYDSLFQQNVNFKRDFLLKEYDILAQILYGVVKNSTKFDKDKIMSVIDHVSGMDSDDFFIMYYMPALFLAWSKLSNFSESDVKALHYAFVKEINNEGIYTKPVKVTLIFVFLTYFIGWCKAAPTKRAKAFDFENTVDKPMTVAVEQGALEQLMVFAAETSTVEQDKSMELFYDMRSLLERHIPRLLPKQLMDMEHRTAVVIKPVSQVPNKFSKITFSAQLESQFLYVFDDFIRASISDCAFLLTKVKNAEEDSLLSGEDLYLDDISAKADLERFFLVVYYFYASRPSLSQFFWQDSESTFYGFIEWAAKCNDNLMKSCFYLMMSSLSYGEENATNVYHYINGNQAISWHTIAQIISDYTVKISIVEKKMMELQPQSEEEKANFNNVALQEGLNEEVVILLSSLLTLIGSVAYDLPTEIQLSLTEMFTEVLFEFIKVNTPLIGATMKVLGTLVPLTQEKREIFWTNLDKWIFKGSPLNSTDDSYRMAFQSVLTNFSDVSGFLRLFSCMLAANTKNGSGKVAFGKLPYPIKLGAAYRKSGIWPYFDFIFHEIFAHVTQLTDVPEKFSIVDPIFSIIQHSLSSFDYSVLLNSITAGVNLDSLIEFGDFFTYVEESPATAAFNYLFEEKFFKIIFNIASAGVDELSGDLETTGQQLKMARAAIRILNMLLTYEGTYTEELCPIVKKHHKETHFIPKNFGLHGLSSYYDAILFDLPLIAHCGLYIGIPDYILASESLDLLKKISLRFPYSDTRKNKVLTVFESVDESARIKEAFISQVSSFIDSEESLSLKLAILDFINMNLSYTNKTVTVAHFLLGFQVTNILSLGPTLSTFINSPSSLLNSLLDILLSSLASINPRNVDYAPIRLASILMEIIVKLCRNTLTSRLTLDFLSSKGLFERIIELDPNIDNTSLWCDQSLHGSFNNINSSVLDGPAVGALLAFLRYRSHLLQYLSLDLHWLSTESQQSKISAAVAVLISSEIHAPTIFAFLDTLTYSKLPVAGDPPKDLTLFKNLDLSVNKIKLSSSCTGNIYDFSSLDALLDLSFRTHALSVPAVDVQETSLQSIAKEETLKIKRFITTCLAHESYSSLQLSVLHSWVQLVQIVVLDGSLTPVERSNFVLEVFEAIVPKINDYVEFDVAYSEELVSLSVFLYDLYQKDRIQIDQEKTIDGRLHALFKTCIHGITSPLSTLCLRSDFYVLANKYLLRIIKEESLAKEVLQSLKMASERLVEVICNDAISGEGSNKITGILLLDALAQIACLNKTNFILDVLMKSNMLLLIIRSIKATDELLSVSSHTITLDTLLYELTAFKSTVYFLIRLAKTRSGAQALIQNEIFNTIESCSFLQIDPDLGLELIFDEISVKNSNFVRVNLNLDNPLTLGSQANGISLFEIVVPIFQLIVSILLSMGNANRPVMKSVKKLLVHFRKLVQGVLKRDALLESNEKYVVDDSTMEGLEQQVKLVVLLCTLTGYLGEQDV